MKKRTRALITVAAFEQINEFYQQAEKQRTCEANPAGENSSFNFKVVYVVLHMAVKEFFETHF